MKIIVCSAGKAFEIKEAAAGPIFMIDYKRTCMQFVFRTTAHDYFKIRSNTYYIAYRAMSFGSAIIISLPKLECCRSSTSNSGEMVNHMASVRQHRKTSVVRRLFDTKYGWTSAVRRLFDTKHGTLQLVHRLFVLLSICLHIRVRHLFTVLKIA